MKCPKCYLPMRKEQTPRGFYNSCREEDGNLVPWSFLEQYPTGRSFVEFMKTHSEGGQLAPRVCPGCDSGFRIAPLLNPPLNIEHCKTCKHCWFEPGEFEEILLADDLAPVDPKINLSAMDEIEVTDLQYFIPEVRGLKVNVFPIVTLMFGIVLVMAFYRSHQDFGFYSQQFGFQMSNPFKNFGANLGLSFFIHVTRESLIVNLIFFWLTAAWVELKYSKVFLTGIILSATVFGNIFKSIFTDSTSIGAGADSAVMALTVFLMLTEAFRSLRIRMPRFTISIPTWVVPATYFGVLATLTFLQKISPPFWYTGAGAIVGFVFWLAAD